MADINVEAAADPTSRSGFILRNVAKEIAEHNDLLSMIFRRFDRLALENILILYTRMDEIDRNPDNKLNEDQKDLIKEYRTLLL
ncbi:hypothetical protein MY3296_003431 [Beauveria thailandica]